MQTLLLIFEVSMRNLSAAIVVAQQFNYSTTIAQLFVSSRDPLETRGLQTHSLHPFCTLISSLSEPASAIPLASAPVTLSQVGWGAA